MSKKVIEPTSRRTFADFTARLAAKWRLQTTTNKPAQPAAKGESSLLDLLERLVLLPTTADNAVANNDGLNFIEEFVASRGMFVKRFSWNGVESLVATTRRTKKPTVMLSGHLDVIPATEDMFTLKEEDGRLYGRGVMDMKFAIADYLQLVDELGNDLKKYDFGLMITTDEEAGGTNSVPNLLEAGYIPKVCILPDGGDDWQIQLFSKGFLYFKISATGKPAHGSRPWLGENAIITLVTAINEIKQLFPNNDEKAATFNIGKMHGGNTVNQVADYAEVVGDIRVTSESEKARILTKLQKICTKHGVALDIVIDGATTDFKLKDPYIGAFAKIITQVTGVKVTGSRTLGSNDTRYFTKYNVPCISFYPIGGGHHGPNEWLDKQAFYQSYDVIKQYVTEQASRS